MRLFFTRLFVSERKQIAMIADEKSPARISHRNFTTKSLRNEVYYEKNYDCIGYSRLSILLQTAA